MRKPGAPKAGFSAEDVAMGAIVVDRLSKSFRVAQADAGRPRWLGFGKRMHDVVAVREISFAIGAGERVAFIGPNGAGKSTTLKMLTGILHPTSGEAQVAGLVPWTARRQLAYRLGIVFGQRSQLWYHLPVRASFDLLAKIYAVEARAYAERLRRLASTFDIEALLQRPVSQLSLGQRIRCEVVAALLHAPSVLLLDEPTIGLDVTSKAALRDHLNALSREQGTTVLLTSHDTGDIEKICDRVIVIDKGSVLLDQPLERLRRDYLQHRSIILATHEESPTFEYPGTRVRGDGPYRLIVDVDINASPVERVVTAVLARLKVHDLLIEDPPLEDIVKAIYRGATAPGPTYEQA
jgi:ABC-2 type transport system ATP-binding protein